MKYLFIRPILLSIVLGSILFSHAMSHRGGSGFAGSFAGGMAGSMIGTSIASAASRGEAATDSEIQAKKMQREEVQARAMMQERELERIKAEQSGNARFFYLLFGFLTLLSLGCFAMYLQIKQRR